MMSHSDRYAHRSQGRIFPRCSPAWGNTGFRCAEDIPVGVSYRDRRCRWLPTTPVWWARTARPTRSRTWSLAINREI